MNTDITALNHVLSTTQADFVMVLNEILQKNNKRPLKPNPNFETLVKVLDGLGLQLQVVSKASHT